MIAAAVFGIIVLIWLILSLICGFNFSKCS